MNGAEKYGLFKKTCGGDTNMQVVHVTRLTEGQILAIPPCDMAPDAESEKYLLEVTMLAVIDTSVFISGVLRSNHKDKIAGNTHAISCSDQMRYMVVSDLAKLDDSWKGVKL